jgi:hypothetical protein
MIRTLRRFGLRSPRQLALTAAILALAGPVFAQDKSSRDEQKPSREEMARFDQLRQGSQPVGAGDKDLLDKVAKYYAGRLLDPNIQKEGISQAVRDVEKRLLPQNPYLRMNPEQRKFVDEFGRAMVPALEPLALHQTKPIVTINAARMLAEVCQSGYDGAADLCIKILEKDKEADASKLFVLQGLKNLFAIEPDKEVQPARTIFQKNANLQLAPLEVRAIQALIAFIQRKSPLPENAPEEEMDAVRYIRCEAIRALGKVRVQSVKNLGQVQGRPALTLLRASRSDGFDPPTNTKERVEAIIGFCQLLADKDRDMQLDYAVYHIGQAICELGEYRNANQQDTSIPWKVAGERLQEALDKWEAGANNLKLANANYVQGLTAMAKLHVLGPLAAGNQGNAPNVEALRAWLTGQVKLGANSSLFKNDPTAKLNAK